MSWTHNLYSSRPSSRSPPRPIHPASHPHSNSRFRSSSPPAPTAPSRSAAHHERERERGPHPVAAVSAGGPIDRAPPPAESTRTSAGGGGDPATKQVDQIVQHFFSKTVAVISQTRVPPPHARERDSGAASNAHDASAAPASGATYAGDAPSLRRGDSSHSGGKRKGDKLNSWFNLTLPENEYSRSELRTWRNVSTLLSSPPPSDASSFLSSSQTTPPPSTVPSLFISVFLDASDLTSNQVLVLSDQQGRRTRVDRSFANPHPDHSRSRHTSPPPPSSIPRSRSRGAGAGGTTPLRTTRASTSPSSVVLEEWNLSFLPKEPATRDESHPPSSASSSSTSDLGRPPRTARTATTTTTAISLPSVYKHSILHFRSLYTLVKLLPAHSLARKLNRSSASISNPRAGGGGGSGKAAVNAGVKIGIRIEVRHDQDDRPDPGEGEVEIDVPIENDQNARATETVRFPGVETPVGTLHLTGTYRVNTDFGVEDIETLLSSRFIDEDFFRPTVNTARTREQEESGRPGSLPISARTGAVAGQSRLGASPADQSPPITGLGPLPSYGSLSSRHQYAPQPISSQGSALPPPVPPLAAPVPLHPHDLQRQQASSSLSEARRSLDQDRASSVSSSSRLSVYGTSVPSSRPAGPGGVVEPAFISLSRARSGSTNVASGIQRASPSPSQGGGTSGIIRRTSLSGGHSSSPSSGSPIFRPGSYLSNPAVGPSSSSPSFGPPSRQQSTFPPQNATLAGSQLQFGNRISPLSPPTIPSGPSNLGATAPSRPIPLSASSSSPSMPGAIPMRGHSYSSTGGGGAGTGSWSRSYGRGSSGSGGGGDSGGIELPGFARRTSSRVSFGGGSGIGGGAGSIPRSSTLSISSREDEKRFINDGKPPQDAGDINDFLKLLDEKPDLGGLGSSRFEGAGGGSNAFGGSTVLRKKDIDEQLKMLRSSVLGFGMGPSGGSGGASSPSPPMPAFALSSASGTSSPRPGFGGISNLRRQTSRLSIEEEPDEDHQVPSQPTATTDTTPASDRRSPSECDESSDNGLTPRQPYRQLRPDLVSPPLSTTSATSTVRQAQTLGAESPMRLALEPRLFPLPNSSATSPLASPATLPPFSSVYPPLPYPPSKAKASTSTSTRTEPIQFSPYISRAARLAQQERDLGQRGGVANAGRCGAETPSDLTSAAASVSSFSTQGDEVDAGSYREEEETVGRLELEDEDDVTGMDAATERGRRYRAGAGGGGGGDVDEEEISLSHSRDPTPAAAIRLGTGYFATRSHSRGEMARRNSPPDAYLN